MTVFWTGAFVRTSKCLRTGVSLTKVPLRSKACTIHLATCRNLHSQRITQNMTYISNDKIQLKVDPKTMKLNQDIKKPLCIIMNWMLAHPKHVQKYAALYLGRGFDALAVSCSPWQLMWPTTGAKVVAGRLLSFLEQNAHYPLVLHGFSVGAYVWSELLIHAINDNIRFQPVLDRVAAQVWDSPADVDELSVGVPTALFPKNKTMRSVCKGCIEAHLKLFHYTSTRYYVKASEVYHATPCRAPVLFFVSESDPIGAAKRSRQAQECMSKMGIKTTLKCWKSSQHVSHYYKHPEEYRALLDAHLTACGISEKNH